MQDKDELKELEDRIAMGLEEAYRKMVEYKKHKNSPVIVSKNGKVVEIKADKISPTIKYRR